MIESNISIYIKSLMFFILESKTDNIVIDILFIEGLTMN